MASFLEDDYYMGYAYSKGSGAVVYIVLMELLSLFCFIVTKEYIILKDKKLSLLYTNLPLLTVFVPLITLHGTMIRLGQYFTMYLMLLVPYAVDLFAGKKSRWAIYITLMCILFLSVLENQIKYVFCF